MDLIRSLCLGVICMVVLPVCGAGQNPVGDVKVPAQAEADAPQIYSLSVTAQVVVLDVVVTDKDGKPVKGLGKDAFQVYEDKTEQRIRTLEQPVSLEAGAALPRIESTADLDRLAPNAPVSIVVLGEASTTFENQAYARYSLKQYLKSQGDVLTQPVMLVASDQRHFMVLRDYTTSRAEILQALDRHFASPSFAPLGIQTLNTTIHALEAVAQATAGHPGHKNMIWIGQSFHGINAGAMTPEAAASFRNTIARCTNMLRDSRVTLYAIDPSGVGGGVGLRQVRGEPGGADLAETGFNNNPFTGEVNFTTLAGATGGDAFRNRNDVDRMIGTSLRDGTEFYTMTYVPAATTNDAKDFRRIRIVMKDRNLTARTREGYFGKAPEVAAIKTASGGISRGAATDVNSAASTLLVYDGIPLTIKRDAEKADEFTLHMDVRYGAPKLDAAGKPLPDLTVVVLSFDKKGKMLARDARLVSLHSGPRTEGVTTRTIDYPVTVATGAPAARLRFVVRENVEGRVGADNVFLVDPKTLTDRVTGLNATRAK